MIRQNKFFLFLFFLLLFVTQIFSTAAAAPPEKKIRVGVTPASAFYSIDEQSNLSGYGYDYLQEIAQYAGWQYEYVTAPWWRCLELLKNGQIDLLGFAVYDDARRSSFYYAERPSNVTFLSLYTEADNAALAYEDYPSFNGLKIGVVRGIHYNDDLRRYCRKHGFTAIEVAYDSMPKLREGLREGEIDAFIALELERDTAKLKKIASISKLPLYFITAKTADGAALIRTFNTAQTELTFNTPYFESLLHGKYAHDAAAALSPEELAYVEAHAEQPLTVAYDSNWAPIEYYNSKTQQVDGIAADLLRYIAEYSGLSFAFKPVASFDLALEMLENGAADVTTAISRTPDGTLQLTEAYLEIPSVIIKNQASPLRDQPILILPKGYTTTKKFLDYIDPNVTVTYTTTVRECFDAIVDGKADMTYTNTYVANTLLQNYKYRSLTSTLVQHYEDKLRLGLTASADPLLISIFNKALRSLPREKLDTIILQNTMKQTPEDTLSISLYRNTKEILLISICFVVLLICIFTYILLMKNRYNKTIEKLAFIDDLTGMWNYNKFKQEAAALLKRFPKTNYAVLYIDISKFKYINNSFGFAVGDHVLRHVAGVLAENMAVGNIFSRSAADQFILMLRYADKQEIIVALRKLYQKMQNFPRTASSSYTLSFSCGIALIDRTAPAAAADINTAIEQAIMAQRTVKGIHGNSYAFYNDAFREQIIKEKSIEDIMEKALQNHEFVVYYQPKYFLASAEISGAEALVRWKNPRHGMIYPNEFIPLFEKNGFITSLDFYVLHEVCRALQKWQNDGKHLFPISVNISRIHVNNPHFAQQLREIVDHYEIPRSLIEVEITESAFTESAENLQKLIRRLKQMDFLVSMDDFGSGFSSLNLLKEMPFDILKIDKDFFQKGYSTEREQIIIASIVEMSQKLNIKVVAEGVETKEQADFLRKIHCDMAQGYLFSKPIALAEFTKKL